jgi:S1-C subfamily serine protease
MNGMAGSVSRSLLLGIGVFTVSGLGFVAWEQNARLNKIEDRLGGRDRVACNSANTIDRVRGSVVRVVGGESEGSGFFVKPGGYILTNHHVIASEPTPKVILANGTFKTAQITLADPDSDLAVLKIDRDMPVLPLSSVTRLKPADELMVVGFPLGGMIDGEATVTRGAFSALRYSKDSGMIFVQTDANMTMGVSGGPMVDVCGDVVAVNAAGLFGLNLGIAADTIRRKIHEIGKSEEPVRAVQKLVLKPGSSPVESVQAFYSFLKARKLDKAFELLSDNFVRGYTFEHWARGYQPLLDTTIVDIAPDLEIPDRVRVKLMTKDFIDESIQTRFFEGYWDMRQIDGQWLL